MNYITTIKYAILFFPIIAFLFTTPFLLMEYHKYGSVSAYKSLLIYSFIFYLICAYFLVILPLPKISEVTSLTSPKTQLIPFHFIFDFVKNTSFQLFHFQTYLEMIKEPYFYVPVFNIFLTIPFGMFVRYYFQCSMKKTILDTLLLSLFFELTQLSGLYFIYPRGYRLFDIDDLFLNTLGGLCGYLISEIGMKILPSINQVKQKAKERGKEISKVRRSMARLLDLVIFMMIESLGLIIFHHHTFISILIFITYYFLIPCILTATLAEKYLNIKVVDIEGKKNLKRLFYRKILFILIYLIIPGILLHIPFCIRDTRLKEWIGILLLIFFFFFYFVTIVKYIFTSKPMLYERLSKTKLKSTIE